MFQGRITRIALVVVLFMSLPMFAQNTPPLFTQGNLVVTVEGCGVNAGTCTNVPNGTGNGTGNNAPKDASAFLIENLTSADIDLQRRATVLVGKFPPTLIQSASAS